MSDLVACTRCNRNNALRRTNCLYCGEPLPVTEESSSVQVPILRQVEDWEKGFTVVLAPLDAETPTDGQIARLCEVARMEEDLARTTFAVRTSVPLVRVPTRQDAELVARLLGASDLGATVVADDDLALSTIARRIRSLEFNGDDLTIEVLWGGKHTIARSDFSCLVEARVVSSTVELLESTGKTRTGQKDLVETSEFFDESFVLDVYGPTLELSFRIKAEAFDYGCLGVPVAPNVETNFARLSMTLGAFVGQSRHDKTYGRLARVLDHAWPTTSRVSSRGIARRGATIKKFSASLVERDTLAQFTRYSRMRFAMARR
jgi:hypothetical protein